MRWMRWGLALVCVALTGCGVERDVARGNDALEDRDWARSEAAFRRALDRDPMHLEALYGLGWAYYQAGQAVEAQVAFERCIEAHPQSHLGFKGLGSVALRQGNGLAAERWLKQALVLAPDDVPVTNTLALTYSEMARLDEALELFERLAGASKDYPEIGIGHVEALLRAKRLEEAQALIESQLERSLSPSHEGVYRLTYARTLLQRTVRRLDASRCADTAPPVIAWLDRAIKEVDRAGTLVNDPERVASVRRTVARRRAIVLETCPDGQLDAAEPVLP